MQTYTATFWMFALEIKLNPKINTIRVFFPKSEHFFRFSSKGQGDLLHPAALPSKWTPASLDEYASIPLNISKYPWKCMPNVRTLNMTNHLTCVIVLNMARLYIQWLQYALVMPDFFSVWLNVYDSICLNIV